MIQKIIVFIVMTFFLVECQPSNYYLPSNPNQNHQPAYHSLNPERPEFIKSIPNLSIVTGKDAVMRCSVKNLGNNIISWHHLETNSDLTINKQVLSSNPRIKIKQDKNDWLLIINNVSLEDRGFYICRINWLEPKSQLGYLNVVEPPRFDESSFTSGSETTVRENSNLTLTCRASGNPSPTIEWRREDGRPIYQSSPKGLYPETGVPSVIGEELSFTPITRWNMGSYLCIASNGVPPSISRRVIIYVQFAPVIRIPSVSVTGTKGANVTLQCSSESSPIADHSWLDQTGKLIGSSGLPNLKAANKQNNKTSVDAKTSLKYTIQLIKTYHFKITYQLTLTDLDYGDTGRYICHAKNILGFAKSSIFLQVKDYSKAIDNSISTKDDNNLDSDSEANSAEIDNSTVLQPSELTTIAPKTSWISSDVTSTSEVNSNESIKDSGSILLPIKSTLITLTILLNNLLFK
ncbi:limbic system-associated membrane protein isoform X2 [Tetranychus urticae]|uniref:Ig-like domain-containing protein n=1 Tax=Tetranychus urticae TaxID=32264 RepID=T1KH74_TETUR|nr:limbic system-associated membrane protein isoform X2 [Tetranychus urticae]